MVKRTFKKQTKRGKKTLRKPIYRRKNKTFRKNSKKGFRKITHKKRGGGFLADRRAKKAEIIKLTNEITKIMDEIKAIDDVIVGKKKAKESAEEAHTRSYDRDDGAHVYDIKLHNELRIIRDKQIDEKLEESAILKSKLEELNHNLQFLKKNSWTKYSEMKMKQEPVEEVNNDEVDVGPVEIDNPDELGETFENPLFEGNEEE